jgi:hypothetical protein
VDDGRVAAVEVREAAEDLARPLLDRLVLQRRVAAPVVAQVARREELGHEVDAPGGGVLPALVRPDHGGVVEGEPRRHLLDRARELRGREAVLVGDDLGPGDVDAAALVEGLVDGLEAAGADDLAVAREAAWRGRRRGGGGCVVCGVWCVVCGVEE